MSLAGLLNQTVSLETFHSRDSFGDLSFNAAVSYPCRIAYKYKQVLNEAGEEVTSRAQIGINVAVSVNDRITLPDTTTPSIIAVNKTYDRLGSFHHSVVYV
jgi:hypothetical protein